MTLLRHALGEDAHAPRYLHTLHGVGYRFDLPLETASPEPAAATPETPIPLSDNPLPDQSPRRRAADLATAVPAPRRWPWLLGLVALGLLAFAMLRWREGAAPVPASPPTTRTAPPTLVVVPLQAIGDDDASRVLADGLGEELIGTLAQVEGLRVIARKSTAIATAESTEPAALAKRLGISHALEGSLQQVGQRLRIRLRLVDARDGAALWAKDFDRDASEVLALQREIAQAVAASLTLKLGLAAAPKKSGDAQFLRRFLAAQKLLFDDSLPWQQRLEPAEAEFRALLRERPDDARVHSALAGMLNYRAAYSPSLPAAVRDEALHEAAVAQRLDPSLAEPYFVRAFIACQRNQWEPCVSLMREADVRGMKVPPLANPAVVLARLGYLDRAEAQAREWIARDPLNQSAHFTLGRLLDTMGRHEEARAEFAPSRHISDFNRYGHWFNAYWRKDYAEAGKLVEEGLGLTDSIWPKLLPGYAAATRALTGQGSWAEVDAENRKFEKDTGFFALLRMLQPDAPAHAPELIAGLEKMRKGSYSTWDLVLWEKEFAFLRRDPAFQDYLRHSGILAYWRKHGFPKQCRPQGGGAACD